jgi:hypothetical protein
MLSFFLTRIKMEIKFSATDKSILRTDLQFPLTLTFENLEDIATAKLELSEAELKGFVNYNASSNSSKKPGRTKKEFKVPKKRYKGRELIPLGAFNALQDESVSVTIDKETLVENQFDYDKDLIVRVFKKSVSAKAAGDEYTVEAQFLERSQPWTVWLTIVLMIAVVVLAVLLWPKFRRVCDGKNKKSK